MLNEGIIERHNSRFANPIIVVKKKNGDLRLCLDAGMINKHTVSQYGAPMTTQVIFGLITGSNVFSNIDLKRNYWLIPLHQNSRDCTAFNIDAV